MILNRYIKSVLIIFIIIFFSTCQGTHGRIDTRYLIDKSKSFVKSAMIDLVNKNTSIFFYDSTDNSDLNRMGYVDIVFDTLNKKIRYKLHFYGDEFYWESHPNSCKFSVIAINGKEDSDFSTFSLEKKEYMDLFENFFIPKLENRIEERIKKE